MSKRQGPPKHQNRYAWKPNLGQKINETVSPLPPLVPRPSPNLSVAQISPFGTLAAAGAWGQVPASVGDHRRLPALPGPNRLEAQVGLIGSIDSSVQFRLFSLLLGPIRSSPFADTASTSQLLSLQSGNSLCL